MDKMEATAPETPEIIGAEEVDDDAEESSRPGPPPLPVMPFATPSSSLPPSGLPANASEPPPARRLWVGGVFLIVLCAGVAAGAKFGLAIQKSRSMTVISATQEPVPSPTSEPTAPASAPMVITIPTVEVANSPSDPR